MEQIYSNYTDEDRTVWKTLFDRQMGNLEKVVSQSYLDAIEVVEFRNDKIPNFEEIDKILGKTTGWGMYVVPRISEQKEFFQYLWLSYLML